MATGNTIEGGWAFTAFSNPEPFSMAVINGFASQFEGAAMDNVGLYASNARDAMIQRWGDRRYIEVGNLSFLHSHGNPWSGPSLEYVPPRVQWSGSFEWGEQGRLQWVALGGCDILGFATYPDGRIAPNSQPRPDRWKDMFKGISGVLGYRSASWYQKDNLGLGASTGSVFASSLLNGMTFFDAWTAAGDFLHRRIGRQAEVAVFLSSTDALRDTLSSYTEERRIGLDQTAIFRRTVGSGDAPHYDYCERVDDNGNWACGRAEIEAPVRMSANVWFGTQPQWFVETYPVLECSKSEGSDPSAEIANEFSVSRTMAATDFRSMVVEGVSVQALCERIRLSQSATGLVRLVEEVSGDDRWTAYRAVVVGDRQTRIFGDFGVVVEKLSDSTIASQSTLTTEFSVAESTELRFLEGEVNNRLSRLAAAYTWLLVERVIPAYVRQPGPPERLVPRLVAYIHAAAGGRIEHFVEVL